MRAIAVPLVVVVVVGVVAAAAPGVAAGKGIQQVVVCGADGCTDVTSRVPSADALLDATPADAAPTHRSPFYRVRFAVGEPRGPVNDRFTALYVPAQRLLGSLDGPQGQVNWLQLSAEQRRVFRRAVRGHRPLPAARMPIESIPVRRGALPPEVVAPPVRASAGRDGDGGDGLGALAIVGASLGMVGAVGLTGRWLVRRRPRGRD